MTNRTNYSDIEMFISSDDEQVLLEMDMEELLNSEPLSAFLGTHPDDVNLEELTFKIEE